MKRANISWPRSRVGVLCFSLFLFGVFIFSVLSVPFFLLYGALLFGSLFILFGLRHQPRLIIVGIGLLSLGLGMFRSGQVAGEIAMLPKGELHAGLIIESTPKDTYQELVLSLNSGERLLIRTQLIPEYRRGEAVTVRGEVQPVDREKYQAYADQLKRRGIAGIIAFPKSIEYQDPQPLTMIGVLENIKRRFTDSLEAYLPEPDASFIAGITIGERASIPKELRAAFADTSTSHLVALSGFNITIVGMAVGSFLSVFHASQRVRLIFTAAVIMCFVMLAGASASIVRAAVMGVLALLAKERGRAFEMTNALIFAAAVMVWINPHILTLDLSFQLSFLATLGIILVPPFFEGRLMWLPKFLREVATATIGAELFVFPLILWNFGEISLVGLFANFLIVPLIPYTMGAGAAVGVIGMISTLAGGFIGWVTHILVTYELLVVRRFAALPGASVSLPSYAAFVMAVPSIILTVRMMVRRLYYGLAAN